MWPNPMAYNPRRINTITEHNQPRLLFTQKYSKYLHDPFIYSYINSFKKWYSRICPVCIALIQKSWNFWRKWKQVTEMIDMVWFRSIWIRLNPILITSLLVTYNKINYCMKRCDFWVAGYAEQNKYILRTLSADWLTRTSAYCISIFGKSKILYFLN